MPLSNTYNLCLFAITCNLRSFFFLDTRFYGLNFIAKPAHLQAPFLSFQK